MNALARRTSGRLTLLVVLMAGLAFGCRTGPDQSAYRVKIPILTASPIVVECMRQGHDEVCELWTQKDIQAVVRELKAACLATGQTKDECQVK